MTSISFPLTIDDLKSRFKEYNKLYFNKELRMPKFKLERLKNSLALFFFSRPLTGELKQKEIWFNTNYVWTDEAIKDVLIHEMIHYWLFIHGHSGSRHGIRFRLKCKEIKKTDGTIITIRKKIIDKKPE